MQTGSYTNSWFRVLLLSLIILTSCNKKLTNIFDRNTTNLVVDDVQFEYLSSRAKIKYDSESQSISGTANIRIHKDSLIWLSLSPGLGIEAARILVTRDSLVMLDKVNKTYSIYDFQELSKSLDFELNYGLVEAVILGNLVYPYERERLIKSSKSYLYSQQQGSFYFENYIGTRTKKLEKIQVKDTLTSNTISVNYSDFQLVDEEIFPFQIDARLDYQKKATDPVEVAIEFKQTEIEKKPLKFPFNIPQRYERK